MGATVEVTSSGIRSVALLVSGILFSTAVLVRAANKGARQPSSAAGIAKRR